MIKMSMTITTGIVLGTIFFSTPVSVAPLEKFVEGIEEEQAGFVLAKQAVESHQLSDSVDFGRKRKCKVFFIYLVIELDSALTDTLHDMQ